MKIDWDSFRQRVEGQEDAATQGKTKTYNKVQFFSLKNDGDEAIVRIMHDSPQDFDLLAVHRVQLDDGKYRAVSCLRNPTDPIDMCPLCAEGEKVDLRIYIHLLEYVKQDNGTVVPLAKVWERSSGYAKKLAVLMSEYGPLSDCIFKIKRHGAAGNMKTEYDILPMSEKVYPSSLFVKDTTLFDGYTALGHAVLDKTYEEILKGDFSYKNSKSTTTNQEPVYEERKATPTVEPTYNRDNIASQPKSTEDTLPWGNTTPKAESTPTASTYRPTTFGDTQNTEAQRPRRTYFQ